MPRGDFERKLNPFFFADSNDLTILSLLEVLPDSLRAV